MKKSLIICLLISLVALVGCTPKATPQEPTIYEFTAETIKVSSRDIEIPAIVTMPKTDGDEKFPLVVMAHGHGGTKDEAGSYQTVAEGLAAKGIATIRMDFPGCGESTEEFVNNNVTNMLADIKSSLKYMLDLNKIDEEKVAILGYSMGGRLATLSLENPIYKAIAMWAPAATNGADSLQSFLGGEESVKKLLAEAEENGSAKFTTPWGQEQLLGHKFFTDMQETKPLEQLTKFEGPVLVIYGDKDNIITPEVSEAVVSAAAKSSDAKSHKIEGADHGFGLFSEEPELSKNLTDTTIEFFVNSLK